MRLKANCPGCRKTFLLSELHAGRRMRCLHCNERFLVEKPGSAKRAPASEDDWFGGQSFHRATLSDSNLPDAGGKPRSDSPMRLDEARTTLVLADGKDTELLEKQEDQSGIVLAVFAVIAAFVGLLIVIAITVFLFVKVLSLVQSTSAPRSNPPPANKRR